LPAENQYKVSRDFSPKVETGQALPLQNRRYADIFTSVSHCPYANFCQVAVSHLSVGI